jgi:hypothetical protein
VFLRDVFGKWAEAKPRSADTVAACSRALGLYEAQTGNPALQELTRASGIAFRTWLQHADRGLGLYGGARISELMQLRRRDIERVGDLYVMAVTDEGEGREVKTTASVRKVPLHSELLRFGFIAYVERVAARADDPIWPMVPLREGKPGGFFSQWFARTAGTGVRALPRFPLPAPFGSQRPCERRGG